MTTKLKARIIQLNEKTRIRIGRPQFGDAKLEDAVDIRTEWKNANDEWVGTKKGVLVPVAAQAEFFALIAVVGQRLGYLGALEVPETNEKLEVRAKVKTVEPEVITKRRKV